MLRITTRSVRRYLRELGLVTSSSRSKPAAAGRTGGASSRASAGGPCPSADAGLRPARGAARVRVIRGSALFDEIDVGAPAGRASGAAARGAHGGRGDVASDARLEERFAYVPPALGTTGTGAKTSMSSSRPVAELRVLRFRYREGAATRAGTGTRAAAERVSTHHPPMPWCFTAGPSSASRTDVDRAAARAFPSTG